LRKAIRKLLGDTITIIDTSEAVVRQLKRQLEQKSEASPTQKMGAVLFVSSKDELSLLSMAKELMSSDLSAHQIFAKRLGLLQ
jgi:glutamate racemase